MRSDGAAGLFRGLPSLIARDVPFNALFYGSYESCCAAMMRAEGLKSKDDLGLSRILFAGGLRGWFQTVPGPEVAAVEAASDWTTVGPLAGSPACTCSHGSGPWPETFRLSPSRPRGQLRLVGHYAVWPHVNK